MLAQRHRRFVAALALLVAAVLLGAACGNGDDGNPFGGDAPDEVEGLEDFEDLEGPDDTQGDEGDADRTFAVTLRGTDTQSAPDDYVTYPADCERNTPENPSLGPVSFATPPSWEPSGFGSGSGGAVGGFSIDFTVGDVERSLEVDLIQPEGPPGEQTPDTSNRAGAQDAEVVATFDWAGEDVDLLFDGGRYTAFLPVVTVEGPEGSFAPQGEFVLEVQFGAAGSGDITEIPRDDVVAVFESVETDRCLADAVASIYGDSTVEIES